MKVEEPVVRTMELHLEVLAKDVKSLSATDSPDFYLTTIMTVARRLARVAEAELVNHQK